MTGPPLRSSSPFRSPRSPSRRFLARAAIAAWLIGGVLLHVPAAGAATLVGKPAPSFRLPAVTDTVSLDSLRGKVVLVDFWASWCVPCRGSFPWMAELNRRFGPSGLAVVAINLDKERAAADRFLADHPAPFTVAFDPAGHTAESWRVSAMPTTFLVGRDGHVLATHAGFDPKKTGALESLIQEACKP